jgi:hypothetical protein
MPARLSSSSAPSAPRARAPGTSGVGALTLGLALAAHALGLGVARARARAAERVEPLAPGLATATLAPGQLDRAVRRAVAARARRELVRLALDAAARRELSLGAFLLRAGAIDAEEEGRAPELELASRRYGERLHALVTALATQGPSGGPELALPEVLADVRYAGRPGGRMLDLLRTGSGSCEPVSQLIAALLWDAGLGARSGLRFYGAPVGGASHVTAVVDARGGELDLMSGERAARGGVRFDGVELVRAYARVHGLAPPPSETRASASRGSGERGEGAPRGDGRPPLASLPSLTAGFPPNADRFEGALPLFAERAVRPSARVAGGMGSPEPAEIAAGCAFQLKLAALDPPRVAWLGGPELELTIHRPRRSELERTSALAAVVARLADDERAPLIDRALAHACLVGLYERASVELALEGELDAASRASEATLTARRDGGALLSRIDWAGPEGQAALARLEKRHAGRDWIVLLLPGGGAVLERRVERVADGWGRVTAFAALLVSRPTRAAAVTRASALSVVDQVDVMHEVFHAHDHARPWATSFELELEHEPALTRAPFVVGYRVFRPLAFRLWEAAWPPGDTLDALALEAARAGLSRELEVALVEYYARNLLGLATGREGSMQTVRALRAWLVGHGFGGLELVTKRLAFIEAEGVLDARTLTDAWKL